MSDTYFYLFYSVIAGCEESLVRSLIRSLIIPRHMYTARPHHPFPLFRTSALFALKDTLVCSCILNSWCPIFKSCVSILRTDILTTRAFQLTLRQILGLIKDRSRMSHIESENSHDNHPSTYIAQSANVPRKPSKQVHLKRTTRIKLTLPPTQ